MDIMKAWNVFLRGVKVKTVSFSRDVDAEHVRLSLIEVDNFSENISVEAA